MSGGQAAAVAAAVILMLVVPAQQAANGEIAVGGDHGDYAGLPAAIRTVQQLNDGSIVLYHRALGSHYRFYLFDEVRESRAGVRENSAEVRENSVELRWFPSTVYLADNAAKMPYPPKYLIEPDWAPLPNLGPHLAMRNLTMTKHGRYGRFTVWEIGRLPAAPCDWCVSRPHGPWPVNPAARANAKMMPR